MPARHWLTCTPVAFRGGPGFFARDSGLLCKGFQAIGIHCRAIMPGPEMPNDRREDLIRTPYRNLESAAWWKESGAQGVVLYGWGVPRYYPTARAIRPAGFKLVCNKDTSGFARTRRAFARESCHTRSLGLIIYQGGNAS